MIRLSIKLIILSVTVAAGWIIYVLATTPTPPSVTYGSSFNVLYAEELGLNWHEVYSSLLTDLNVRHLRLSAHWPMVEPRLDTWNFEELDEQMRLAEEHGASVVLSVGRRLPRWPECHVPDWAQALSWDEQKEHLRRYITHIVNRYRSSEALLYWQVENEPFLVEYAYAQCGPLDRSFLDEEIALVRSLDPEHPILVTDSGNLGTWHGAYRRGDVFGTSVYVHLYNPVTGPLTTVIPPQAYSIKRSLMELLFGSKETLLIELSLEPWFDRPLVDAPVHEQIERFSMAEFESVLRYAKETRLSTQYLWGAEWWYWMREQGQPEYWDRARQLFTSD